MWLIRYVTWRAFRYELFPHLRFTFMWKVSCLFKDTLEKGHVHLRKILEWENIQHLCFNFALSFPTSAEIHWCGNPIPTGCLYAFFTVSSCYYSIVTSFLDSWFFSLWLGFIYLFIHFWHIMRSQMQDKATTKHFTCGRERTWHVERNKDMAIKKEDQAIKHMHWGK